jgi:hypothetical protein
VTLSISPSTLNAASNGNWVKAHIETGGWPASDILVASLSLDGVAPAGDGGTAQGTGLTVKFPRAPFAMKPDGDYVLTLTGTCADGTALRGTAPLSVHGGDNGILKPAARRHDLRVARSAGASATLAFTLTQQSDVTVEVLDLQGRIVARLERGNLPAGDYQRDWPARGQSVPSGIYLVRLRTVESESVVRLAIMR